MRDAELRIYEAAPLNLAPARMEEMLAAKGSSLFVAGNYPDPKWQSVIGSPLDREFHYQITVGIAVDPPQLSNLLAEALISRDPEEELFVVVWNPKP